MVKVNHRQSMNYAKFVFLIELLVNGKRCAYLLRIKTPKSDL